MSTLIGMPAVQADPLRVIAQRFPFAAAVLDGDDRAARYAESAASIASSPAECFRLCSQHRELKELAGTVRRYLFARPVDFGARAPDTRPLWERISSRFD